MKLRYLFPHTATMPYNPFKKRIIENPQTIGEKILNRRLELGLFQSEVAKIIGVCEDTITNWEKNRGEPQMQCYPNIIKFLGYFPFDLDTTTLAEQKKRIPIQVWLKLERNG